MGGSVEWWGEAWKALKSCTISVPCKKIESGRSREAWRLGRGALMNLGKPAWLNNVLGERGSRVTERRRDG